MGRGISELQRTILLMAYENHKKYTSEIWIKKEIEEYKKLRVMSAYGGLLLPKEYEPSHVDLYHHEIFAYLIHIDPAKLYGTVWHFKPEIIGYRKYNSLNASISRTFSRLHKRGLVNWYLFNHHSNSAIELTEKGIEYVNGYINCQVTNNITVSDQFPVFQSINEIKEFLTKSGVENSEILSEGEGSNKGTYDIILKYLPYSTEKNILDRCTVIPLRRSDSAIWLSFKVQAQGGQQ